MKIYKANMGLFIVLPTFVTILILIYMSIIYSHSYRWINIINIGLDGVILIYYFISFSFEVRIDNEWVVFYNAFKKYRMKKEDIAFVMHSSILTKVISKKRNFYFLTTPRERNRIQDIFKDINKKQDDKV